ncbi:hypothetical protein [uncultured Croceitalea sp.]|uniref:hypothetical protein n=1 Tax=uncultured Croceitalea sp. TaxID=1798908 RepID=UPI00374F9BC6
MKAILALIVILFFGVTAIAQNVKTDTKVATIEMSVVLSTEVKVEKKIETTIDNTVARVYKFKNTRVKKALVFETKTAAKIA